MLESMELSPLDYETAANELDELVFLYFHSTFACEYIGRESVNAMAEYLYGLDEGGVDLCLQLMGTPVSAPSFRRAVEMVLIIDAIHASGITWDNRHERPVYRNLVWTGEFCWCWDEGVFNPECPVHRRRNSMCDICHEEISGSHYHCMDCKDPKTTSMLGHYSPVCRKRPNAKGLENIMRQKTHVCCPNGYCELENGDDEQVQGS